MDPSGHSRGDCRGRLRKLMATIVASTWKSFGDPFSQLSAKAHVGAAHHMSISRATPSTGRLAIVTQVDITKHLPTDLY